MEHKTPRETFPEIPLLGGRLTPGIVRIGDTVHRPSKNNAGFVHELLLRKRAQELRRAFH